MVEEFPNNSQRAGQSVPPEVDKQIEKIIEGEATVRKPSRRTRLRQSFIAGDASSVSEHVFWNLLIPAAKDALSDMGSTFIDMMIYGEKRNRPGAGTPGSGPGSTSKINYGSYSGGGSRLVLGSAQNNPVIEHQRFSPNEIIVGTRAEAEGIITKMFEVLEKYHVVTVADLYRMVGVTSEYTDNKWGWNNLDSADVKRVRDGVLLVLPLPQDLG
jgi:hypothetical protein